MFGSIAVRYFCSKPPVTVATPTASPDSGAVESGTSVALSCATIGASIYYTVDGSTPTAESTLYSSAISITEATTIKAIGIKTSCTNSNVATFSYTIAENND